MVSTDRRNDYEDSENKQLFLMDAIAGGDTSTINYILENDVVDDVQHALIYCVCCTPYIGLAPRLLQMCNGVLPKIRHIIDMIPSNISPFQLAYLYEHIPCVAEYIDKNGFKFLKPNQYDATVYTWFPNTENIDYAYDIICKYDICGTYNSLNSLFLNKKPTKNHLKQLFGFGKYSLLNMIDPFFTPEASDFIELFYNASNGKIDEMDALQTLCNHFKLDVHMDATIGMLILAYKHNLNKIVNHILFLFCLEYENYLGISELYPYENLNTDMWPWLIKNFPYVTGVYGMYYK